MELCERRYKLHEVIFHAFLAMEDAGAVPVSTLCVLCVARIGRAVNAIISKKLLLFAGIPGFVAVIAALILFVRTLMPSGSSALLPSAMGRRFLLRSVHLPGPHLVQGSVPRFL